MRVFGDAVVAMTAALPMYLLFFDSGGLILAEQMMIPVSWDAYVVASRFGFCLGVWILVFIGLSLRTYGSLEREGR